ncbi:MAG: Holliday junction resolvase RuvX [Christensenellales bacterium]
MKIAGLDVGQARIGIAISDEMEILASSVESYHCKGEIETDARAVSEKLIELGAQKIVIGLPKNMNGTEGPAAEKCRAFGEMLGKFLDIEQVYSDERLTTVQAQRTLIGANVSRKKRKNVVDKLAAQLILQNYLDAQGVMR